MPALFDLFFRRPRPQPRAYKPSVDTVGRRLVTEMDVAAEEYNVPGWFVDYIKADVETAFTVWGKWPAGYEAGIPPPAFSILAPISSGKKVAASVLGIHAGLWATITGVELLRTESLQIWMEKWTWDRLRAGLVDAQGNEILPASLVQAVGVWSGGARSRIGRLIKQGLLKNNPGLALMMADALRREGVVTIAGIPIVDFIDEARKIEEGDLVFDAQGNLTYDAQGNLVREGGIAARMAAGDWDGADAIQKQWAGTQEGRMQAELIKEFERRMKHDPSFANTPEGHFWRYWQNRNVYYTTLNFLQTWHADGLSGVVKSYIWARAMKGLGPFSPNEIAKAIAAKLPQGRLRRGMASLTSLRTAIYNFKRKVTVDFLKKIVWEKGLKVAITWVVRKLGLQALGAALGSAIPGAGTAVGAFLGAVATFFVEIVIDKFGGLLKASLYIIGGALIVGFSLLLVGAMSFIVLIITILNVNAAFPGEGGAEFFDDEFGSSLVVVTKEVCEPADTCSNFQSPLEIPDVDGSTYQIKWRITFRNISEEDQTVTFSDRACIPSINPLGVTFAFGPGEEREYECTEEVVADDDKVVSNVVRGMVASDNSVAAATGLVIIGDPGMIYPMGWPTASGCISQGPGGAYSHAGNCYHSIDIVTSPRRGEPVFSTHDGVVARVHTGCSIGGSSSCGNGYGNHVRVRSPAGFTTIYAHLYPGSITLTVGSEVHFGDVIGRLDHTGYSTGDHLHYEFKGLDMGPPYIPASIGACSGSPPQPACNYCF